MLAWLDTTAEEQRLTRELLSMFSQEQGLDAIGIGQIRDAFSDLLFPGTSTLHTRARYFLIVPWCYTHGDAARARGEARLRAGRAQERRLTTAMPPGESGVIGARAGAAVKNLPSNVYWSGLERYGILTRPTDRSHLDDARTRDQDATELTSRSIGAWHPSLPEPPQGFPETLEGGLAMAPAEQAWLAERILSSVPDSLLAHLIDTRETFRAPSEFPWDTVDPEWGETLQHAYVFSTVIHGAQLVYNLLVAQKYEENTELDRVENPVSAYRERIDEWAARLEEQRPTLAHHWNQDAMQALLHRFNRNISSETFQFVFEWIDSAMRHGPARTVSDHYLQGRIAAREHRKGPQSRLHNPKLLATWQGGSGANQLTFRWPQVKRMVHDIVG